MAAFRKSFSSLSSSFQSTPFRLIFGRAIGSSPSFQSCRETTFRRYLGPFPYRDLFAERLKRDQVTRLGHLCGGKRDSLLKVTYREQGVDRIATRIDVSEAKK